MELILHIGQSKTGTSAIQHFLSANRERLAENGILYPAAKVSGHTINIKNHNAFADSIEGRSIFPFLRHEEYLQYYEEMLNSAKFDRLLLSAEHFFGGEPRIWDCSGEDDYYRKYKKKVIGLKDVAAGKSVHIVAYLRPQVDWFCSAVSQTVRVEPLIKRGKIYRSDESFLELMSPLLRYDRLMGIWKDVFPDARFSVIPYIRKELINQNIVDDFCTRLSIDTSHFEAKEITKEVNSSFSLDYIEVKKRLNTRLPGRFRERAIIKCLLKLSKESKFGRNYVAADNAKDRIHQMFQDGNGALSDGFLVPGSVLPVESEASRGHKDRPSELDVASAWEAFHREFRKPIYRLLELNIATKALLREYFPAIHAKLHTVKHGIGVRR